MEWNDYGEKIGVTEIGAETFFFQFFQELCGVILFKEEDHNVPVST